MASSRPQATAAAHRPQLLEETQRGFLVPCGWSRPIQHSVVHFLPIIQVILLLLFMGITVALCSTVQAGTMCTRCDGTNLVSYLLGRLGQEEPQVQSQSGRQSNNIRPAWATWKRPGLKSKKRAGRCGLSGNHPPRTPSEGLRVTQQ